MPQLLRFQLYSDSNRSVYTQIHPDIPLEDMPPRFKYGESIRVGDDADDKATWPEYRIAHIIHLRQEPDPDRPGKNRVVYEVYLANEGQWREFKVPEELKEQKEMDLTTNSFKLK